MAQTNQSICLTLPKSITKQISTCENSEHYVTNFLQNALPSTDSGSVADELRKSLVLVKHKNKWNKRNRCKGKLLTSRKRMQLGLRKIISKGDLKYTDLLPLHQLWLNYMQQVLGTKFFTNIPKDPTDPNWENVNQQLVKADFHGAKISVVGSKCPTLAGLRGIVIQDTKNTFRICGKDNIVRSMQLCSIYFNTVKTIVIKGVYILCNSHLFSAIPKDVVIMKIDLTTVCLEFFGKDLSIRPTERTIKKFKCGRIYEL